MSARATTVTTPTVLLWVFALSYGVVAGVVSDHGLWLAEVTLPFLLAYWVVTDARRRNRTLCYDFDTFVFFAWPILIPIYLFQTRGIRALMTLLYFLILWSVTWAVTVIVSLSIRS
jgi:hypothetical protein